MRCLSLSLMLLLATILAGCEKPVSFPAESLADKANAAGAYQAYQPSRNSGLFFTFVNEQGRIDRIGYADKGQNQPNKISNLDTLDKTNLRHLVIILDGFGYDVVKKYYDDGGLRYCYPPSRVIVPYPVLTDICIEDMLDYVRCRGYEAQYFDRKKNEVVGGSCAYLQAKNEPYIDILDYRADMLMDAFAYVDPWAVFGKEINDIKRLYDKKRRQEMLVYIVSSAGMSTRFARQGQEKCLKKLDQLINQIMWESRGLLTVTLLADHGHSYTHSTRIDLESQLKKQGWHISDKLKKPRDVIYIRFGLETYAAFWTNQRPELAADLIAAEGVELASYTENGNVVVLGRNGQKAVISRKGDGYKYEQSSGDPLRLAETLKTLKPDAEGYYDRREMFDVTVMNYYPAPLERLWRAHFGIVEHPADVIVSLDDKYYSGSRGFDKFVNIASTHGGLNRSNSTTFIMSSIAPLPAAIDARDVPACMKKIRGKSFPQGK